MTTIHTTSENLITPAAQVEIDRLQQRIDDAVQALAEQTARAGSLTDELIKANDRHEQFKRRVLQEAKQGKVEHDWCYEINRIVERLGLEWDLDKYTAEVTVSFTIKASLQDGTDPTDVTANWVQNSLTHETEYDDEDEWSELRIRLDSDSRDVTFENVQINVTSVSTG